MGCKELSIESYYRFSEPGEKSYMRPSDCEEKTAYIAIFREAIVDNWNVIAQIDITEETDPDTGEVTTTESLGKTHMRGEDLSGSLQGAGGVGGLLAVTDSTNTYLPTYDANGNVMAYVDASDGSKVAEYEYSPSPDVIVKSGPKADELAQVASFSTIPWDKHLNAFIYPFRILKDGRFLSRDPMEEEDLYGNFNLLYGFVSNDVINKTDFLGLTNFEKVAAGFQGAGFILELTAVEGEDCSEVNFIQVLEYKTKTDPRKLQLDPTVASRWHAPLYYAPDPLIFKRLAKLGRQHKDYPKSIMFGDQPSISSKMETNGEQAKFILLVVDAYRDRAELLMAVTWGFGVGVPTKGAHKGKLVLFGQYRAATATEISLAIGVIKSNNYNPFESGNDGKYPIKRSDDYTAFDKKTSSEVIEVLTKEGGVK